jgi:N-acetylmuramoyl-L-alanine amidase
VKVTTPNAILAFAAIVLFSLVSAAVQARPAVLDVRLGVHAEKTRIVVEMTQTVEYRVTLLTNPFRVVIDLPDVEWRAQPSAGPGAGLIARYRFGLLEPGTNRMVLDAPNPVRVAKVFSIAAADDKPARFVVDLQPATSAFDALLQGLSYGTKPEVVPAAMPAMPLPAKKPSDQRRTIVIDAGHGGVDPGAIGPDGIFEKELTLAVSTELKRQLEATGRYRVVMTRDRDLYLPLAQRVTIGRAASADLFLSIHADSIDERQVRGASVYTLSETASDGEAARLAARENKADALAGVNLAAQGDEVANILINLAMRDTMNQSKRFANTLVEEFAGEDIKLLPRTHRFAGFAVLKAPDVPSILLEMGYLSSPHEARLLASPGHHRRLSAVIVKSIDRYFGSAEGLRRS